MPCAILMARHARRQRRHRSGGRRGDGARGTSFRKFSRDLPEYRARINAEVLPLLEWLRAKGMDVPAGEYMSHFIALDSRPDTHWIAVLLGPEGAAGGGAGGAGVGAGLRERSLMIDNKEDAAP